jgi:hypothetical protein
MTNGNQDIFCAASSLVIVSDFSVIADWLHG